MYWNLGGNQFVFCKKYFQSLQMRSGNSSCWDLLNLPISFIISWVLLWTELRKKYPYSEFFWSVFSRIRTEYGEVYLVQNAGKYGPEKLRIRKIFTQCRSYINFKWFEKFIRIYYVIEIIKKKRWKNIHITFQYFSRYVSFMHWLTRA